jgi:HD-like signal output (HDOD) protein
MREELLEKLRSDVNLPVLPEVLVRLDKELSNPDVEVRSISSIISMDPILAGQVLRMSNSAYYSRGGAALTNTGAAVMRLGIRTVRGLVYALSLPRMFDSPVRLHAFSHAMFWKHSLGVGAFSQALGKKLNISTASQDLVYFAGLVHDIGALLFLALIPEEYDAFLASFDQGPDEAVLKPQVFNLAIKETEAFGINHCELGAIFLEERWKMDSALVELVRDHHKPDWNRDAFLRESLIVHVADGVCSSTGASWEIASQQSLPFLAPAWEHLEISLDDVSELLEQMQASLDQAQALLVMQS